MKVRNINRLLIIFSLFEGKKHGYEIIKEIEEKTGKRPSASQIYPFLEKMEEEGYIKMEEEGKRGKKVYSLTGEGEDFVESKFKMFSDIVESTIKKDLSVCAHCGCKVYEGGHSEEIDGEELNFCCKHCASTYQKSQG